MNLALKCEKCLCHENIQIGNNWYDESNSSTLMCYWCQHERFLDLYNVTSYEPKIHKFEEL